MQGTAEQPLSAARVAPGPGVVLRQAREAAGLAREDLVLRTRLDPKVIEALENEDYGKLAAGAFVKGYIRSISRELGLDPAPLIAQYEAQVQVEDPAISDFESRPPTQITSSSTLVKLVSVLIGLALLGLVAAWWQRSYHDWGEPPADAAALAVQAALPEQGPLPDPAPPLPYSFTIVEHSVAPLAPAESWVRQSDGSEAPPRPTDEAAAVADEATAAADPAEAPPAEAPSPPPPSGEVTITARGDSWIEITDLAGKRLYFGLVKQGQPLGVSGQPPYEIVVGNVPAVEMSFRGEPVDLEARAVNGVARFTLGEPE